MPRGVFPLRYPMRLALVYAPYFHKRFNENLQTVDDEFGRYPPLDLLYVSLIVKQAGHDVILVEGSAERLSKEEALARIRRFGPDLLAFSLHSVYNFFDTLEWIRFLKQRLGTPVIVGGICFTDYPDECMAHGEIDFGLMGTARKKLPRFLNEFSGKRRFHRVPGLAFRTAGKVRINRIGREMESLYLYPTPSRELIPNDCYYQYISKRKNFTIMLTMVGCPYKCNFCAIVAYPFLMRPAGNVLAEIDNCYLRHGIREIDFFDAIMTLNKRRIMSICEGLQRRGYDLIWSCRSRIDTVDDEMLAAMAKAGCVRIYYGIEASDDDTLRRIGKGLSLERVKETIGLTKKHGIMPLGFFIIGNPGETRESVERTVRYAKDLGLDYAQFSMMLGKPGTPLYEDVKQALGYDYWREYLLGNVGEQPLPNPHTKLTPEEMLALTRKAYMNFYFTPRLLAKTLRRIRSVDELRRYVTAGLKMVGPRR